MGAYGKHPTHTHTFTHTTKLARQIPSRLSGFLACSRPALIRCLSREGCHAVELSHFDSSGLRLGHRDARSSRLLLFPRNHGSVSSESLSPSSPPACLMGSGGKGRALSPKWSHLRGLPVTPVHQGHCCCGIDLGRATPVGLPGGLGALPRHARCQLWGQEAKAPCATTFISKSASRAPCPHPRVPAALGPADFCSPIPTVVLSPAEENTGDN